MSTVKHYTWSAVNRFGVQLIGFIGNVLIARQLTPDDYGLVAMLAIFMGIAWNLTESGFADCLIRKPDADSKDYATIFMYNIFMGIFLYLLLFFTAPFIAQFFKRQELVEITRILGLSIILKSVTVTEFTKMRKELKFKSTAIIQIVSSILSVIIAFIMAHMGFGYWAIVFQTVSIAIINLVMIIFINKWVPQFYFSWERYKVMRGFSLNILLSYFTNQIGNNLYSLFIGKHHATSGLGHYNQGTKINDAAFQGINAIILSTSYPLIAKEKDRSIRKKMYESVLNHFMFIQLSTSFFIIGSAYPLIMILFGEKWLQTAPYLQLITISYLFIPLTTLNSNIIKIEGKSKLYRNLTFLRNGLNLVALLFTFSYSIEIILAGQIISRYISVFIDVVLSGRLIELHAPQQFIVTCKQLLAPLVSMVIAYFVSDFLVAPWLKISLYTVVYLVCFFFLNKIAGNATQVYYVTKFKSLLNRIL